MKNTEVDQWLKEHSEIPPHKEYKYLYQQMLKDEIIRKAYKKLRKGKTKRKSYREESLWSV